MCTVDSKVETAGPGRTFKRLRLSMGRSIRGDRGSLIVDAACILPIFIIASALLMYLINWAGMEAAFCSAMTRSARWTARISAFESVERESEIRKDGYKFQADVQFRGFFAAFSEDAGTGNVRILRVRAGERVSIRGGKCIDNIITAEAVMEEEIPVPAPFVKSSASMRHVVFRPFVGESQIFDGVDDTVYVFPKKGERYHFPDCIILKSYGFEMILTPGMRRDKRGCKLCDSAELPIGAKVYTSEGGRIYHRKSCPTVEKEYVAMPKSEAVSLGYTPCMLCVGGHSLPD